MRLSKTLRVGGMAVIAGIAVSACSMVPTYRRPATATPAAWSAPHQIAPPGATLSSDWWERFGSKELDELMSSALLENRDLGASLARVRQAQAEAKIAGAALLPSVDASASVSRSRNGVGSGVTGTENSSQGLLTANYELDLWGANRAAAQAAGESLKASIYSRDALSLAVQSEVATTYFEVLALRDRLEIARRNLQAAEQLLKLVEVQYRHGANSELEVAQQRSAVATYQAQIPVLEQQRDAALHALAVLVGKPPEGFTIQGSSLAAAKLPSVATGQPATLLERRPDILEAEASLFAANADIGVARAAFLPSVTLTAEAGVTGLVTAGGATVGSLAAGLAAPIFHGGDLRGGLEQAEARRAELAQDYGETVLSAFSEVEDALTSIKSSDAQVRALTVAADEARKAYRLAMARYKAGGIDFITVLDSERSQLSAEDSLVQARYAQYAAAVSLFKAMGGSWKSTD